MPIQKLNVSPRELESSLKVAYLYFAGMKQADIAKQLGFTTSKVSRALSRARQFVELKYSIPGDEQLEAKLLLRYRLKEAVVVQTGVSEQAIRIVGQAAAKYFRLNISSGDNIALSCGETLLEMVKNIPTQPSLAVTISQLSIEGDPHSIHQSPATLVGLMKSKLSYNSVASAIQLPPAGTVKDDLKFRHNLRESELIDSLRKSAHDSNYIFIGVAPVENSHVSAESFLTIKDSKVTKAIAESVRKLRIVGEINNRLFDEDGKDRTDEIPELREYFITILELNSLRRLAKKGTRVILVATGIRKFNAIQTALKTGLANVVITDREVAMRLCNE